jgi:hypothetical protein
MDYRDEFLNLLHDPDECVDRMNEAIDNRDVEDFLSLFDDISEVNGCTFPQLTEEGVRGLFEFVNDLNLLGMTLMILPYERTVVIDALE